MNLAVKLSWIEKEMLAEKRAVTPSAYRLLSASMPP